LVSKNEPHEALFGGARDGLELPRLFIATATRLLKPGGFLILEYFENQSALLERELSSHYSDISHYTDLNQRPRWMTARRKGE